MPAEKTLAETLAEGRRLIERIDAVYAPGPDDPLAHYRERLSWQFDTWSAMYGRRLLDVAEKTLALFVALDRERPGWRGETCTVGGDEVNRAWYELEKSLGLGPDDEGKEKSNDRME